MRPSREFSLTDRSPWSMCSGMVPLLELTYETPEGKVANELLYRDDEPRIEVVGHGRPWSFDGDGGLLPRSYPTEN